MSKSGKGAKVILGTAAGITAAYYGLGGALYYGVLGRPMLNHSPEENLNDAGKLRRYANNEIFRAAQDWFDDNTNGDYKIINKNGETLHAEIIKQPTESHLWAVLNHGYSSRPEAMARQGLHYYNKGFNTVFPYMRGHRKSEQKYSTMGYFERYDIVAWIEYITAVDPEAQIIIHGCSMGAATTMLTTGEELPKNVKCAVADCGYTNCYSQFKAQIKNVIHLPPFPFLNMAESFSKQFMGWSFKDCSPKTAVSKSKTPTLFIHGEKDLFVPYEMMDELYNACSAEKDKLSVPDAGHDLSCEMHPDMYWEKTDAFVGKYVVLNNKA